MKKRPIIFATILLLVISGIAFSVSNHSKEPLAKFVEIETGYTIYSCIDENGEIEVVVEFKTEENQELYSQYCARLVLDAIKKFPRQSNEMPKEVTVRLYNEKAKQTILRISVKGDRLFGTSWDTLLEDQIINNVDYYYFDEKA